LKPAAVAMTQELPITEKEISRWTEAPVYSPILCASIDHLGISSQQFVQFYGERFSDMALDWYDVKRKQWELLPAQITSQHNAATVFTQYYLDRGATLDRFVAALDLDRAWYEKLSAVQPWRRRSVCSFRVELREQISIHRVLPQAFQQKVDGTDIRSLPRVFEQTHPDLVDHPLFQDFLCGIASQTQRVTPHVSIATLNVAVHFMSVNARLGTDGSNSPEGPHEDGADFIVSALVVNRKNISGGISQVLEKMPDGRTIKIFERELQPGEFLFQADTGEEKHYGNDLWHYVTPILCVDPDQQGCRDIIGLDISIDHG
jgi:hypothetical protein